MRWGEEGREKAVHKQRCEKGGLEEKKRKNEGRMKKGRKGDTTHKC
jgi:hypothetical protein